MKTLLLTFAGLILVLALVQADPVVITRAAPIEKLDADQHPCGVSMAQVGAAYTLVKQEGNSLVLKDKDGAQYLVASQATNYSPPAAPTAVSPVAPNLATNAAPVSNSAPVTASAAATNAPSPTYSQNNASPSLDSSLSKEDADKIQAINTAFGLPLLKNAHFWQDDVDSVAQRLGWAEESRTTTQESYRRYTLAGQITVLGTSPYSVALYGKRGRPTYLSLIFANEGDFAEARKNEHVRDPAVLAQVRVDLAQAVKKDTETITGVLTPILGSPAITFYGNSASNREEVHRWDWNDVAILLNSHEGEYVSIKIIPAEVADHYGTVDVMDRSEMRDLLVKRVVKRDNGDVVVSDLPMVDQGPKGYCVPATWERYLRYMDVPADLYVLAIMGGTGLGGSTSIERMMAGVDDYVEAYHRRIEIYDAPLDVPHVAKYIDQGLPLMWTCWVVKPVEIQIIKNTQQRKTVTDWPAYAKSLVVQDTALGSFSPANDDHSNGHMRLIIGYNAATDEIAISDSWGSWAAERWMYVGTAVKTSQRKLNYLSW